MGKRISKSKKRDRWMQHFSESMNSMHTQAQDAVMEAWQELDGERRREILSIMLFALSLASILALISYNPADLAAGSLAMDGAQRIHNWIGKPGAWLAWAITFVFGSSGFAVPALLLMWGIDRIRNGVDSPIRKLRIAGFAVLLIISSSFLGMLTHALQPHVSDEQLWRICGAIGYTLNRRLSELGPMGAIILNGSLLAVSLLVCTPFLFTRFFQTAAEFLFPEHEAVDDENEEDFIANETITESGGRITLQPFREGAAPDAYPTVSFHDDEYNDDDDGGLPSLLTEHQSETKPVETASPALAPLQENGELRIVTSEEETTEEIDMGVNLIETPTNDEYQLPSIQLLEKSEQTRPEVAREEIIYNSQMLEQTLSDFNISAKVVEVNYGPTITCYEIEPAPGIKISRIENLANDITRALKAEMVRIVAPIPGKGTVGVEVPNQHRSDVLLRDVIASDGYHKTESKLKVALGKTISGEPFIFDLMKAPHQLVAGATGSGKSVCINTIITSILYNAAPHEVKLLLIDPKQVELALYKDIPHLLSPVVTDPKKAGAALRWAVEEMEQRYRYLKKAGVRNIKEYNKKRMSQQKGDLGETEQSQLLPGFLPFIVIIIDELADLMMVVRQEVEGAIARLAAMARAVGIHLVLATQRPSVDVLTGVIKNNFPARMAFQVSSNTDSRTILDMKGAESLMGRGDMLFTPGGAGKPIRLQCSFVSTEEVEEVCDFVRSQQEVDYVQEEFIPAEETSSGGGSGSDVEDELYEDALQVIMENDAASTSLLQRRLKIGYGRAARLLDLMEERGIVGPPRGSKPRQILLNGM
ncbi:MAG: DNA translocase FtsK [Candidatus Hinthialibacter antarcticus]|nr:DNA translocase FtsK [Candidatus Hinthialibacter antarcticus]